MNFNLSRLDAINKKLLLPPRLLVTIMIGALGSALITQQHCQLTSMMESEEGSHTTTLATISEQCVVNYDMSALESFVEDTTRD